MRAALVSRLNLPEAGLRIASILKSPGMRDAVAAVARDNTLARVRGLDFSASLVAKHLEKAATPEVDTKFFASRQISEAIVLIKARPVLFVKDGIYEEAELEAIETKIKPFRKKLTKPIGSVGRIELMDHDTYEWCGTGWRIEEDIVITNRHVANLFAEKQSQGFQFRRNTAGKMVRARTDFNEEYRASSSFEFELVEVLWISPDVSSAPDVAVLRIKKDSGLPPPLTLMSGDPKPNQDIAVVGYPARDSRNDAGVMRDIFGDVFDVKRFAPGAVISVPKDDWFLTHDCTTLGGNSGSAVLALETGEVAGLHFGGEFRKANYAVKASVLRSLMKRRSWIPVTSAELKIPAEAFSEKKRTAAYMAGRGGFDKNFLGEQAALPTPGKSHSVLKVDASTVIPYTHFSIVMSASRRLPILTAVNIDGALKLSLKRKDAWGFDPRLKTVEQLGHAEFYGPAAFDKGHMVRREDPGWGNTEAEALLGEQDSFVYTNAVPQMPQLNQRSWLALEDYVLQNAKTAGFKVSVFTGPVFRDDDPEYEKFPVPLDFWKVAAMIDSDTGELSVSAYMLSQEGMMPEEGFRYGLFRTYQVPLTKVEAAADVKFANAMRDADVFNAVGTNESLVAGRFVEVRSAEDVVLTRVKA